MSLKRKIINTTAGVGAGIAASVMSAGCGTDVPKVFAPVNNENVPHQNETFGQQGEICEDSLTVDPELRDPKQSFDDGVSERPYFTYEFGKPIGKVNVGFQKDKEEVSPITRDWAITHLDNGHNRLDVYLWDNPSVDGNGEVWTLEGRVYSPNGDLLLPIDGSADAERFEGWQFSFQHHYTVTNNCDIEGLQDQVDEIQDQVDQNTEDIGDLEDGLEDHMGETVPPAHTPGEPPIGPVANNGICEEGETWRTEYGCNIPKSVYQENVSISITTDDGTLIARPGITQTQNLSSGNYRGVLFVGSELESALQARGLPIPQSRLRETGESDCAYTIDGEPFTRTVSGGKEYATPFELLVGPECKKDEIVEFSSDFGEGRVFAASAQYWHLQ